MPVGATSIEVWLAGATQTTVRSARDQVRLAETLAAAPVVAEKMAAGGLSVDNARLLGAVVGEPGFAGDAELLLEIASGSPRDTRRGLESWLAMTDPAGEVEREEELWTKRHLTFTRNGDGMYDVEGLLMPVDVAAVQTALDHIAGAAFADETGRPHHTRIGDAMVELCKAYNAGTVTGGRERPKVLIAVPFETVTERGARTWCDRRVERHDLGRGGAPVVLRRRTEPGRHPRPLDDPRLRHHDTVGIGCPVLRDGRS